ncbi:PhnE/PtxC family ABC transporter permease [Salinilacihabitans rarus]|uniref:PhnE/PtxC family ABC transporter permease n=1 Tax=Salinilacihabitans rarus TaxID=2961596 RepID=UPI0020C9279D|nr:phosphate/phosphonate ABC transporter permease [Salinilacihabitans rarus]
MSTDAGRGVEEMLAFLERRLLIRRVLTVAGLAALLVATYFGGQFIGVDLGELLEQREVFFEYLQAYFNPDFVDFTTYSSDRGHDGWNGFFQSLANPVSIYESLLEQDGIVGLSVTTIVIGFTGTVIGFPFALLFGVLGSERVVPFPFNFLFRGTMSTIRAIPALVWILIYVPLTSVSPVGAMLAIATDTVGNLGRLFTDELEEIDDGPIEAIGSTGASRPQIVGFGMLSQVSTSFIAWTLYILEINVRIAISLGVYGAGGIGEYIELRTQFREFEKVAAGIFMVILIVLTVELVSSRIRARLRPGEHESKGLLESIRGLGDAGSWLGIGGRRD